MAKDEATPKPERMTLAGQLARQHELLMAQATKPARTTPQSVELAERHQGPQDGLLRIGSIGLLQEEDEDDVAFVGRVQAFARSVIAVRDTLNAEITEARQETSA